MARSGAGRRRPVARWSDVPAVEVILITMLVYLSLSLLTSLFMNWFNARMALVER